MKYSISELIDMLTIVNIKLSKVQGVPEDLCEALLRDLINAALHIRGQKLQEHSAPLKEISSLTRTNLDIFNAVDVVQESDDDTETAIAGRRAQQLNLVRSKLKKAIDEYFEGWSKEVKI